jgi:hypothetical protein
MKMTDKTEVAGRLSVLYEQDETAWLETMSRVAATGQHAEMDFANLSEYLSDMAKRDRGEVFSRLVVLLTHLVKWEHTPEEWSSSWQIATLEQRQELRQMLESCTLYNHAVSVRADAYRAARTRAAIETTMPQETFPRECAWDVVSILADDDEDDDATGAAATGDKD